MLDEHPEAVRVVDQVYADLQAAGVTCFKHEDVTSHSQNANLNELVNWHNSLGDQRDFDISVHFNAGANNTSALVGTEVYYYSNSQKALANQVSAAIAAAASWPNRGGKQNTGYFFLAHTTKPALLLEVCFVDSSADGTRYRERFSQIARAIAETLSGVQAPPEPIEPPVEPPIDAVPASVDIVVKGNVRITVNGQEIVIEPEVVAGRHVNIFATWFGGSQDPNNSAYSPYGPLDDVSYYVALPWTVPDPRPKVRVTRGDRSFEASVADKGPWTTMDEAYVMDPTGKVRPVAETCYDNGDPLPHGPHAGEVPGNPAGIDLSPALFKALGMTDNGPVDWEFVEAVA
jgi:N-acetylmuramoyl-L-alanine amidase